MAGDLSKGDYDLEERKRESKYGKNYKWITLSNTTLGVLMASIDSSILIISLPAIFNGLGVNPLIPGNIVLLLWLLLGYMKAAVIHEYGDAKVFKHEDIAIPEPGADEVLVKVHYANPSRCTRDHYFLSFP